MTRLIFYFPFPIFASKEEYDSAIEFIQKHKSYNTLPMKFDENVPAATWEKYLVHIKELRLIEKKHKIRFKKRFLKKGIDCETLSIAFPKEIKRTRNLLRSMLSETLSSYDMDDILFIHSHGNPEIIGTGGFRLYPDDLANTLNSLGLSQTSPPMIVVWACKSGLEAQEGEPKSYALELKHCLKNKEFLNVTTTGIAAKIVTKFNENKLSNQVSYIIEKYNRRKTEIILSPSIAVKTYLATPLKKALRSTQLKGDISTRFALIKEKHAASSQTNTTRPVQPLTPIFSNKPAIKRTADSGINYTDAPATTHSHAKKQRKT